MGWAAGSPRWRLNSESFDGAEPLIRDESRCVFPRLTRSCRFALLLLPCLLGLQARSGKAP